MTLYVNPPLSSILIDTVITLFPHQLITTTHGNYNYNNGKYDAVYVNPTTAPPKVNPWALGGKFCHRH